MHCGYKGMDVIINNTNTIIYNNPQFNLYHFKELAMHKQIKYKVHFWGHFREAVKELLNIMLY